MHTRRSPRNQEILFRQLFQPPAVPPRAPKPIPTDAEIDAMPISRSAKAVERRVAARARLKVEVRATLAEAEPAEAPCACLRSGFCDVAHDPSTCRCGRCAP